MAPQLVGNIIKMDRNWKAIHYPCIWIKTQKMTAYFLVSEPKHISRGWKLAIQRNKLRTAMVLPNGNIYHVYSHHKGMSLIFPRQKLTRSGAYFTPESQERELWRDCLRLKVCQSITVAHQQSMPMMRGIWSCPRRQGFGQSRIWPCHVLLQHTQDFSSPHFPWQLTFLQHVLSFHRMTLGNE